MNFYLRYINGYTLSVSLPNDMSVTEAFMIETFSNPFRNMLLEKYNEIKDFGNIPIHYLTKFFKFIICGSLTNYFNLRDISQLNSIHCVNTNFILKYIKSNILYLPVLDNLVDPRNRQIPFNAIRLISNFLFVNPNLFYQSDDIILHRIDNRNIRSELINVLVKDIDYKFMLSNLNKIITKNELLDIELNIIKLSNKVNDHKKLKDSGLIRKIRKKYF